MCVLIPEHWLLLPVRNWFLILFMALHGHRCSEAGAYCPDAKDIKVPQEPENWERGPDGLPKHLEITYRWWKGHSERSEEGAFIMWRNPLDARFCLGECEQVRTRVCACMCVFAGVRVCMHVRICMSYRGWLGHPLTYVSNRVKGD